MNFYYIASQKDLNCQVILVYSNLLVKYFYVTITHSKVLYMAGFIEINKIKIKFKKNAFKCF